MQDDLRNLLHELRSGLKDIYLSRLKGVYLFGSYARGEQDAESDVDVLIVLDKIPQYGKEIDRTSNLVSQLSLSYNLSISRVFVDENAWMYGETLLLSNVREEAIPA